MIVFMKMRIHLFLTETHMISWDFPMGFYDVIFHLTSKMRSAVNLNLDVLLYNVNYILKMQLPKQFFTCMLVISNYMCAVYIVQQNVQVLSSYVYHWPYFLIEIVN